LYDKIINFEADAIKIFTEEFHQKIKFLFDDITFQKFWDDRKKYSIPYGADVYFKNFNKYLPDSYTPDIDDIACTGTKTSKVQSFDVDIKNMKVSIYDLGSSKIERKKFPQYSKLVNFVLFFFSLDEYCYTSVDDKNVSMFNESLEFLANILESNEMKDKEYIIMLTKNDILNENVKRKFGLYEITQLGFSGNYTSKNVIDFYKSTIKGLVDDMTKTEFLDGKNISFIVLENGNDKKSVRDSFFDTIQLISEKNMIFK
jgi:hypothetical protein